MYYICSENILYMTRKFAMSKVYRPYEPDQMLLLPASLHEWLPRDHMVYFLQDVLDAIDLDPIMRVYEKSDKGYPPYHPKMLTGILFYGYTHGVFSSRKLARNCQESIPFRVMAANNTPDHRTISDFRKRHLEALEHIFLEVLRLCREAGLVKFGHVSVDGTKVKANASQHKAMSYGRMNEEIVRLEKEIHTLVTEAERADSDEDRKYGKDKRGDELPEELSRRESRLEKIKQAKRALEEQAKREQNQPPPDPMTRPEAKIKTETDASTGEQRPVDRAQRNFTDPDSRIMPAAGKTFIQGYNPQVAVDSAHQIIVGTYVTNCPNDYHVLPHLLTKLLVDPKVMTADAGYPVDTNLSHLEERKIDAYIAVAREHHARDLKEKPPRGRIPDGLSPKELMRRKLKTKKGKKIYARRKTLPEPVFGHIKHVLGFRQFSLRGQIKVMAEWFLVTAAVNLRKLFFACAKDPRRKQAWAGA
jgi:transposase